MEWIRRGELHKFPVVDDLEELLQVMEQEELTEFQYIIENGMWKIRMY